MDERQIKEGKAQNVDLFYIELSKLKGTFPIQSCQFLAAFAIKGPHCDKRIRSTLQKSDHSIAWETGFRRKTPENTMQKATPQLIITKDQTEKIPVNRTNRYVETDS